MLSAGFLMRSRVLPSLCSPGHSVDPPTTVAELVARLKSLNRPTHGLKQDLVSYEAIAETIGSITACRGRARSLLNALADALLESPDRSSDSTHRPSRSFHECSGSGRSGGMRQDASTDGVPRRDPERTTSQSRGARLGPMFMHGARLRLATRLGRVGQLGRRFECVTIDSFAWRLLGRWRALAARVGGAIPDTFDGRCDLAGTLLERPEVCAWVIARFPIVVIDEAQDLRVERLRRQHAARVSRGGGHALVGVLHQPEGSATALRHRMRELAQTRVRFGYRRLRVLLQREGWDVGKERFYRVYTEEGFGKSV